MLTRLIDRAVSPEQRAELARRVALARQPCEEQLRTPSRRLLLGELDCMLEPVRRRRHPFEAQPARRPRPVMLLPGFATHPVRLRYMARQLEQAGHRVSHWGTGMNWGATADRLAVVERRLLALHEEAGEPMALVGWSLGGLFARELAKRHPAAVSKVVTMGTPFSGSLRHNNVWRAYQAIVGHSVDELPIETTLSEKPPVETVALWSPRDGVVSPRCACGRPGERDRAVALRCTHMGFIYSAEAIEAVLVELDQTPAN